ncbi:MAG: sn-glycerol-3-phosphate transport system permease protein UgpA [Chloroflexi bacterium ADurb.Bin325]|nr:MAG: sn-glycerol-3-phosphate transport system permease protein UgpA [Chloroflexi bacterium ADurb.Bin325]
MAEMTARAPGAGYLGERRLSLVQRVLRSKWCYILILPTFILVALFNYYPAGSALYHSFFNWNGANLLKFIGLDNFIALMKDSVFWLALGNMLKLTVASVIINLTFPLLAAALIFHLRALKLAYFYRVLFVIPMVVPAIVVLMIWRFIYSPNIGLLNEMLRAVNLGSVARPWLGDFKLALAAIIFIGFPWISGFSTLIYLAGFQAIPTELLDAAAIDGASTWARFTRVELPLIMSQIKLIVILTIIGSFQGFTTIMIMTNGGPGQTTMVPGLYLYRNAMHYGKMGYACAIGTVLFLITMALTYINIRYLKSSVEYVAS